jgi:hypothetical protein
MSMKSCSVISVAGHDHVADDPVGSPTVLLSQVQSLDNFSVCARRNASTNCEPFADRFAISNSSTENFGEDK